MAEGHAEARHYPLSMLAVETEIARKRENGKLASEVALTRLAMASVLDKKAAQQFKKELEKLSANAE